MECVTYKSRESSIFMKR